MVFKIPEKKMMFLRDQVQSEKRTSIKRLKRRRTRERSPKRKGSRIGGKPKRVRSWKPKRSLLRKIRIEKLEKNL